MVAKLHQHGIDDNVARDYLQQHENEPDVIYNQAGQLGMTPEEVHALAQFYGIPLAGAASGNAGGAGGNGGTIGNPAGQGTPAAGNIFSGGNHDQGTYGVNDHGGYGSTDHGTGGFNDHGGAIGLVGVNDHAGDYGLHDGG